MPLAVLCLLMSQSRRGRHAGHRLSRNDLPRVMAREHDTTAANADRVTLAELNAAITPPAERMVLVDGAIAFEPVPVRQPFGRKWSRERLLTEARTYAAEVRRPFSIHDFTGHLGTTHRTIYRNFPGGWTEFLATAGLEPCPKGMPRTWTDAALLDEYGRAYDRLGRHPSFVDLECLTAVSTSTIRRRFGPKKNLEAAFERHRSQE